MTAPHAHAPSRRQHASLVQFTLRELFLCVVAAAVYFALVRSVGPFWAALAGGVFILVCVIKLLRTGNPLFGGFGGLFLASGIVAAARVLGGPVSPSSMVMSCLCYPMLGYILGVICAADNEFR